MNLSDAITKAELILKKIDSRWPATQMKLNGAKLNGAEEANHETQSNLG